MLCYVIFFLFFFCCSFQIDSSYVVVVFTLQILNRFLIFMRANDFSGNIRTRVKCYCCCCCNYHHDGSILQPKWPLPTQQELETCNAFNFVQFPMDRALILQRSNRIATHDDDNWAAAKLHVYESTKWMFERCNSLLNCNAQSVALWPFCVSINNIT